MDTLGDRRPDSACAALSPRGLTGSGPLPAMSGANIDHQAALRQQMEQMQAMQVVNCGVPDGSPMAR